MIHTYSLLTRFFRQIVLIQFIIIICLIPTLKNIDIYVLILLPTFLVKTMKT